MRSCIKCGERFATRTGDPDWVECARCREPKEEGAGGMMEILTPKQVAEQLAVSVAVLATWRKRGVGPKYLRFNGGGLGRGVVRYTQGALTSWLVSCLVETQQGGV